MEVNIRIEQGRCHECGHEYLVLSHKVEHPKEIKVPEVAQCPECGSENPVTFTSQKQFIHVPEDSLEQLTDILLQNEKCAQCGKALSLLSGERVDLVFKMEKVINEAEGLVEEWTESVPFCQLCKGKETEEVLINASLKYFESGKDESSEELLKNAKRSWKC